MKLKYEYWLDDFRKAFRLYLTQKHPNWNEKSVATRESDAFIFFRWYSEEEAWEITITQGEHIEKVREELEDLLVERKNTKKDATGYIRAIRELQEFVHIVVAIEEARKQKPRSIQLEMF